ncbi:MAG: RNA-binding transcriptional accessory protein [Deltaproteobacteria bacterium]|nr:RNA-binding transcriptional accessory protein [Deltaproteobacteria bacterium]
MTIAVASSIAKDLALPEKNVAAVLALLQADATVPFIARYRKEATGGLDEVQIRSIEEKHQYQKEMAERRKTILGEIEQQGKLTPELRAKIEAAALKAELEDLYLPYKPKRRTRAMIAREKGLEPLALRIVEQPLAGDPKGEAAAFVNAEKGVATVDEALAGARDIVAEIAAETAPVRAFVRELFLSEGVLVCTKAPDVTQPTKFEMYYDFREPVKTIPSHRFLAVRRGETENVLRSRLEIDGERAVTGIAQRMLRNRQSPFAKEMDAALADAWNRLLAPSVENEVRVELKLQSDRGAVEVFADNLKSLLLAAPLGGQPVIGVDPGQRTGCKVAVVDATGRMLEHTVLYLVQGDGAADKSKKLLADLVKKHKPRAVAVGNGTYGRETEDFVRSVLKGLGASDIFAVQVSESGASVYSASDIAREEFPDLDLTVRGAISIARRLQDPLSELVKVDPKAIGVGQYQHDVFQPLLAKKLDAVVEDCVNKVGVELNTASAPLLARVAGIGPTLSKRIVEHRDKNGAFKSRAALASVHGLGPKTFEQCAGFLRIAGGEHPLDASAVHPERYALVEKMAKDLASDVKALIGDAALVAKIEWKKYLSGDLGEPTLKDILAELKKPGRDPRQSFVPPAFRDDVRTLEDLKPGMSLEGVVTNVTAFGAFVDVGVHQDGLVHVSQLADKFVKTPSDVVKPGDRLKVRVLEVDLVRKRISLTARSGETVAAQVPAGGGKAAPQRQSGPHQSGGKTPDSKFTNNPFARLLNK